MTSDGSLANNPCERDSLQSCLEKKLELICLLQSAMMGARWKDFIAAHMAVLAGIDFFTVEVLTWRGLATYYVLFFVQLESRRVNLAGITRHPDAVWMEQMARNAIDPECGHLRSERYVLHDRDTKFCATLRSIHESEGVKCLTLPARSPNLNAFAERWVRSVKQECLRKLVLFGEGSLRRALSEYMTHYHSERNHQGKGNLLLFPEHKSNEYPLLPVRRVPRLGGLLSYYARAA
jgi:putative transposase